MGDAYVAVTGLPTCGTKATSESVTNIAHLALEMLGQLNNLDHENESMCEVSYTCLNVTDICLSLSPSVISPLPMAATEGP